MSVLLMDDADALGTVCVAGIGTCADTYSSMCSSTCLLCTQQRQETA